MIRNQFFKWALCLTAAFSLSGCATDQRFHYFRNTEAAPPDGGPALVSVTLVTDTGAYAKLPDSGLWVLVTDRSGKTTVARVTNVARSAADLYESGTRHQFEVPLDNHKQDRPVTIFYKEGLHHFRFAVGMMAQSAKIGTQGSFFGFEGKNVYSGYGGENLWTFDATVILRFNDGSTLESRRVGQGLSSQEGKLVFTRLE
jgi:hypothetical protein